MRFHFCHHRDAAVRMGACRAARNLLVVLLPVAVGVSAVPAQARLTDLQITNVESPAFGGATFGSAGHSETLTGIAHGEVDPKDPRNAIITDIEFAPRNARGMVEYSMNVVITKPVDMSRGNATVLYDVPNRGRIRSPELNIGGNATAIGDGFLESEGYTLVDSGWEGDLTSGLRINLPIAKNRNGSAITGRVRSEYILDEPQSTQDVTAPPAYEAVSTSNADATLTMRVHQDDPKVSIPNSDWAFADCSSVAFPGVPDTRKVCLKGGVDTNHIYELVYTAKNPTVAGLGFAATRDLNAFLRNSTEMNGNGHGRGQGNGNGNMARCNANSHANGHNKCPTDASSPPNPLGDAIRYSIIYGSSQSGRWIRTFIQLGFNEDENGNQVFDGAIPHKASNRGAFNVRFAQPTRLSGTQHTEKQFPGAESSQTWGVSTDPITGITAGQLDRCMHSHTCPKIFHTNTDTEYWQATMALNTTDSFGTRDLPLPSNVRIYLFASTHHGGGNTLAQPPAVVPAIPSSCQLHANSNPFIQAQRALLVALQEWIVGGTEPPPSLYPTLAAGTLVPVSQIQYPYVPAVNFTPTGVFAHKVYLDRGRQFDVNDISGVMAEPPNVGGAYNTLVPKIDENGNTADGLRNTTVRVPLGTYMGSNVRKAGFSEGDSCDLTGSFIPFFKTQAERMAAGDPRPSLEERYPTHADYVAKVTAAANALVDQRLLLPADATFLINQASAVAVP
jgi:hypothetical protein